MSHGDETFSCDSHTVPFCREQKKIPRVVLFYTLIPLLTGFVFARRMRRPDKKQVLWGEVQSRFYTACLKPDVHNDAGIKKIESDAYIY